MQVASVFISKLLRLSGYNAAVCSSRWQGGGKVPGGDNETWTSY
ncbi:BnaC04g05810D [Brassica napus]|uniref:(rape) hypothetical protein n=1 Tax=Brassica napus TaxID=3708 RepID=A0A078G781_BRANA|nr:unnamed protein product [Brassica napus]CDY20463.1 BnaC04g05810D [Brassica napus]